MKKTYQIKKKESLSYNLRQVLPGMFDDFFAYKDMVIRYSLRRNLLHEMRKAGKPLRYAMELGEYCFGNEFKKCLEEVKHSLELMGEIHDADVMMPEINLCTKETRLFNTTLTDVSSRISTKMLRDIIISLRDSRRVMYEELVDKLSAWQSEDFKSRMINAMNNGQLNV